ALEVSGGGVHNLLSGSFEDNQESATQTVGIYARQAVNLHVEGVDFGDDIADGDQVLSAGAGTVVTFGRGNRNIVTIAKGTFIASGDGATTAFPVTLSPQVSPLGGGVLNLILTRRSGSGGSKTWASSITVSGFTVNYDTAP